MIKRLSKIQKIRGDVNAKRNYKITYNSSRIYSHVMLSCSRCSCMYWIVLYKYQVIQWNGIRVTRHHILCNEAVISSSCERMLTHLSYMENVRTSFVCLRSIKCDTTVCTTSFFGKDNFVKFTRMGDFNFTHAHIALQRIQSYESAGKRTFCL